MITTSKISEHLARTRSAEDAIAERNENMRRVIAKCLTEHSHLGPESQADLIVRTILAHGYAFYNVGEATALPA